jgi:hypothetical protein
MKKIVMTKYGFERWPEEDFSDDGTRFQIYKAGKRVRVSKAVSNGMAYIAARIDGIMLPFEVYGALPHYKALDNLNGVPVSMITEEELVELYEDCLAYEKEYDAAEASIQMPTLSEIEEQCKLVTTNKYEAVTEVVSLIKNNITVLLEKLSDYQWKNLKHYYNMLVKDLNNYDARIYPKQILGTAQSIYFCKPTASALQAKESFYYREIKEIVEKAKTL